MSAITTTTTTKSLSLEPVGTPPSIFSISYQRSPLTLPSPNRAEVKQQSAVSPSVSCLVSTTTRGGSSQRTASTQAQVRLLYQNWLAEQREQLSFFLTIQTNNPQAEFALPPLPPHLGGFCGEGLQLPWLESALILTHQQILAKMLQVAKAVRCPTVSQVGDSDSGGVGEQEQVQQTQQAGKRSNKAITPTANRRNLEKEKADRLWLLAVLFSKGRCEVAELVQELGWPTRTVYRYKAQLLDGVILSTLSGAGAGATDLKTAPLSPSGDSNLEVGLNRAKAS